MRIFDRTRFISSKRYVEYQGHITSKHLIPLFKARGVPLDRPILDLGCGTGGCAITLSTSLRMPVTGVDIDEDSIIAARGSASAAGALAEFHVADVLKDDLPSRTYGLILIRDLIEHVADPESLLERLRPRLDADGYAYLSFPPWFGPYASPDLQIHGI